MLGWPENTEDLKKFYPTDVLVTGYDIIFFWVARMIFSGCEHTGKTPFHTVLILFIISILPFMCIKRTFYQLCIISLNPQKKQVLFCAF